VAESWQQVSSLENEDPVRSTRAADVVALVAGIVFCVLAVLGLTGLDLDAGILADGGLLWLLLVGAGVVLLVNELRRARRRSSGTG
jgi:hypothetical protein